MIWMSTAIVPVAVISSFQKSCLSKSTSFELSRVTLLVTLFAAEWQSLWGILKGNWLSNWYAKLLMTQCWQDQGLLYYYFYIWTFAWRREYSVPEVLNCLNSGKFFSIPFVNGMNNRIDKSIEPNDNIFAI